MNFKPILSRRRFLHTGSTLSFGLGVNHEGTFPDRTGRPRPVVEEEPIVGLI